MRTGPASSAFASVIAMTMINGQRNDQAREPVPSRNAGGTAEVMAPRPKVTPLAPPLHAGTSVAPGQLLFTQLMAQEGQEATQSHRQGVAAYPSIVPTYEIASGPNNLVRLRAPGPDRALLDLEV